MYELIEALHLGQLRGDRRHELTPVLFAVAEAGDAVARAVVERQAEEIVTMAAVLLGRLGLLEAEVPVILGGGSWRPGGPAGRPGARVARAPRAPRRPARGDRAPVLGAALLGLDHLAAPPAAYERLRAHYGRAAAQV
ncbi:hypothetical protein NKH77_18620 [Streptomyces sp. M19]